MKQKPHFFIFLVGFLASAQRPLYSFQPINVNQASEQQICVLPGIGMAQAKRIVELRTKNGPFMSLEELVKLGGLSQKKQDAIKGLVTFERPKKSLGLKVQPSSVLPLPQKKPADFAPAILEVQEKAFAFLLPEGQIANSWQRRARQSPWLPELTLIVDHGWDDNSSQKKSAKDEQEVTERVRQDLGLGVKAQWHLPALLFHPSELEIAKTAIKMAEFRQTILQKVNGLYFERKRLLEKPSGEITEQSNEEQSLQMRLGEVEAELDGLTGGWFSLAIKEKRLRQAEGQGEQR